MISEFKGSLIYRVSLRIARATHRNPISNPHPHPKKKERLKSIVSQVVGNLKQHFWIRSMIQRLKVPYFEVFIDSIQIIQININSLAILLKVRNMTEGITKVV